MSSQEILNVDYGNDYLNFKEMGYREFAKNEFSYKSPKSRSIRERFGHGKIIYLGTPFLNLLHTKNRTLAQEFENEIFKIKGDFKKSMHGEGRYWGEFEDGTKKSYNYFMLNLEKFEIVAEHFKDLYNLDLIVNKQKEEIENNYEILKNEFSVKSKNYQENIYKNSSTLNELKFKSSNQIQDIELFFNSKTEKIGNEIKMKIDNLGSDNYNNNKRDIINKYAPSLVKIHERKQDSLANVKSYWNDKIQTINSDLDGKVNKQISILESEMVKKNDSIRIILKSKYDLASKENQLFEKYEQELKVVNQKIKSL